MLKIDVLVHAPLKSKIIQKFVGASVKSKRPKNVFATDGYWRIIDDKKDEKHVSYDLIIAEWFQ
jgi:hypothetical protein